MANFLTLRTSTSPYGDFTKGSVLSQSELDSNFIFLKGEVIYTAITSGNNVTLKKYNGNDITFLSTSSGGTGTTSYFIVTKAEVDTLISASGLTEGAFYKITGVHSGSFMGFLTLYGGTDIILQASSSYSLSKQGIGLFYNPKYDSYPVWENIDKLEYATKTDYFKLGEVVIGDGGQTGTTATLEGPSSITIYQDTNSGDWTTATSLTGQTSLSEMTIIGSLVHSSYNVGDKVIWGGRVWENLNGSVGSSVDMFNLDGEWSAITYNTTDYNLVADIIEYQYEFDWISFRKDNLNEVRLNYEVGFPISTISCFPWGGRVYLAKIDNGLLIDEAGLKRNLLNFNAQALTLLEMGPLALFSADYWGHADNGNSNIARIKLEGSNFVAGLSFGDYLSTEDLWFEPSTSMVNVAIANQDDNSYKQGLRNIRLRKGYSIDGGFLENSNYIEDLTILGQAYIDNLELGSSESYNGTYISKMTLFEGASMFNVKIGDDSYISNFHNSGSINNINMGMGCYMDQILLDSGSSMFQVNMEGGSIGVPYADSYISNLTLTNSYFSGVKVGNSSLISNVSLNNQLFTDVVLGQSTYIDDLLLNDGYFFNVNLKGGFRQNYELSTFIAGITADTSIIFKIDLGYGSKLFNANLTTGDTFVTIAAQDSCIISGITTYGSVNFGNITMNSTSKITDISIGSGSIFAKIELGNISSIGNFDMSSNCEFSAIQLAPLADITNVIMDDPSNLIYINLGVDATMDTIYMPSGTTLSDLRLGGPLSLVGFTGSSLTNSYGYIIDYNNNNFPATLDITGLSNIDLTNVFYAGEVILTSSNPTETINYVSNSARFYPVKFLPSTGLTVSFKATNVSSLSANTQFINSVAQVDLTGDTRDYIVIKNVNDNYLQVLDSKNNL